MKFFFEYLKVYLQGGGKRRIRQINLFIAKSHSVAIPVRK